MMDRHEEWRRAWKDGRKGKHPYSALWREYVRTEHRAALIRDGIDPARAELLSQEGGVTGDGTLFAKQDADAAKAEADKVGPWSEPTSTPESESEPATGEGEMEQGGLF